MLAAQHQTPTRQLRVAVLAVSDSRSAGRREDRATPLLLQQLAAHPALAAPAVSTHICPDDAARIRREVLALVESGVHVVLTTGGTGFGARDVTPEAIAPLLEKPAPGLVAAMLAHSLAITPLAALSRPVAGVRGATLIVTLPGSPKGARENLEAIAGLFPHIVELASGRRDAGEKLHRQLAMMEVRCGCDGDNIAVGDDASRVRQSPFEMVSVDAASRMINARINRAVLATGSMRVASSASRCSPVIAEDVMSGQDVPNCRASIVDGYAIANEGVMAGNHFRVVASSTAAENGADVVLNEHEVCRVSTGAVVPRNATRVVMIEDTEAACESDSDAADAEPREKKEWQYIRVNRVCNSRNIREPGADLRKGAHIFQVGDVVTPLGGETALLLSAGVQECAVFKQPRVAILATGDELVLENPKRGQVIDAISPVLRGILESRGLSCDPPRIVRDTRRDLEETIASILRNPSISVIVSSGGVSMGERDFVKPVVESLGGQIHFGRVNMKPGKPLTFATFDRAATDGGQVLFFGLPGNPVSAIVCFHVFVVPALRWLCGEADFAYPRVKATLETPIRGDAHRPEYHRVAVTYRNGAPVATSTGDQQSSRALSLKGFNALACLPASTGEHTMADVMLLSL